MKTELLKGLSEEQIAKVKACKSQEELLKIAKEEGIELTDEQLQAINGGACISGPSIKCPKCGSSKYDTIVYYEHLAECRYYVCKKCGTEWGK